MIKVRIAPSPTGKMHIGTARTALFNKLFALSMGGTYCVRIEDTDKERSTPENIDFIKDALGWLNLTPDGNYVLQTENVEAHKAAAQKLIDEGKAYTDDGAVRFKIPSGQTTWADAVQGEITYDHENLEDFVILRSDGSPTYHLGVVVDDASMEITHIIRGDDHINNTPKQILLHEALGNTVPTFAHIPLIYGEDGKKLSKRHGAVSVQEFRDAGILPDTFAHYLMQLSWLAGDALDPTTIEEAAKTFSLEAITKSPARFDAAKLDHLNGVYLRTLAPEAILTHLNFEASEISLRAVPHVLQKAKSVKDIQDGLAPFYAPFPFALSEELQATKADGQKYLAALREFLTHEEDWSEENLDDLVKSFITENGLKFPLVGKPLRIALTGQPHGLGLGALLAIFGKEEALKRL